MGGFTSTAINIIIVDINLIDASTVNGNMFTYSLTFNGIASLFMETLSMCVAGRPLGCDLICSFFSIIFNNMLTFSQPISIYVFYHGICVHD